MSYTIWQLRIGKISNYKGHEIGLQGYAPGNGVSVKLVQEK
jgi:hypothetical protein